MFRLLEPQHWTVYRVLNLNGRFVRSRQEVDLKTSLRKGRSEMHGLDWHTDNERVSKPLAVRNKLGR